MAFNTIPEAIHAIKNGEVIILVDEENRENEGDFVQAAECVTPESINFMITHGRGLVCQCITKSTAERLQLAPQTDNNTSLHETGFTVSVDAKEGTTTGISVYDRAHTIQCIASDLSNPSDLAVPGHIFPIIGVEGGVLSRKGHTEGAIDIARLAGKKSNGVICEVLNKEGRAANLPELEALAKQFNLIIIHINDLVTYLKEE